MRAAATYIHVANLATKCTSLMLNLLCSSIKEQALTFARQRHNECLLTAERHEASLLPEPEDIGCATADHPSSSLTTPQHSQRHMKKDRNKAPSSVPADYTPNHAPQPSSHHHSRRLTGRGNARCMCRVQHVQMDVQHCNLSPPTLPRCFFAKRSIGLFQHRFAIHHVLFVASVPYHSRKSCSILRRNKGQF